ncbi:glycosyltransferase [Corynebacterium casei]|uniref:glycosyltransferase n=1 Tax=Corynebacterium casei TaxID=160386 RepID=UPI003FD6894D
MLKGNTRKLGAVGIAAAVLSGLLGIFSVWPLAVFFLAVSLVIITLVVLVIHRFLVQRLSAAPDITSATNQISALSSQLHGLKAAGIGKAGVSTAVSPNAQKAVSEEEPRLSFAPIGNFIGAEVFRGGIGPEYEFAERAIVIRGKLETFALRTRSMAMRDVFARAATNLHYNAADVQRILRVVRSGQANNASFTKFWRPDQLLALARILANQRLLESDLEDAEVIFNAVRKIFGDGTLKKSDIYIYSEVLTELGMGSVQNEILKLGKIDKRDPIHYKLVKANLFDPRESHETAIRWLQEINALFTKENLQPIEIAFESGDSLLDSISSLGTKISDGPLVSVIVPTFKGSDLIETTIKCLKDQTWNNLEIIVVDDGSGQKHTDELERIIEKYEGVQLILQPENLGAYPARNRALDAASGEFITVHDDDDWSHPQKIQVQVEHLLEHNDCVANMTRHVRVTPDLTFTRINNNPSVSQPNFSSLMLRKSVVEELGRWDHVNRGADAEFRDRLVAATGKTVEVLHNVPLSFTRTHPNSLTAGEIGRGYIDPSRLFYQRAYQLHHEQAEVSGVWTDLNFAKPCNMLPGNRGKHLGKYDVIFITDFAFPGGTSNLTLNEIEASADAGLRVGLIHMFSPANSGSVGVTERSLSVVSNSNVDVLSLTDSLEVSHLIVRHPSVLQFAEGLTSAIQPERVSVIVNNPPVLKGGKGFGFDLYQVRENAVNLFGVDPKVYAESGVTHKITRGLVDRTILENENWPGFVKFPIQSVREVDPDRRPILGRHSRDAELKWPSYLSTYRNVYAKNDVFDVHIMGGISSISPSAQEIVKKGAQLTDFGGMSVPEFLNGVDFWSYYHSDSLRESFGMAIVEAMSAGVPVILPEYMKANFGDGAIYAKPADVQGIVANLWSNPELYSEQSARGIKVVQEKYTKEALFVRLGVMKP